MFVVFKFDVWLGSLRPSAKEESVSTVSFLSSEWKYGVVVVIFVAIEGISIARDEVLLYRPKICHSKSVDSKSLWMELDFHECINEQHKDVLY